MEFGLVLYSHYVRARLTKGLDVEVKARGGGKFSAFLDVPVVLLHTLLLFLLNLLLHSHVELIGSLEVHELYTVTTVFYKSLDFFLSS